MASISTTIGLNSGVDIASLVDQLVALSGKPRDNLQAATTQLQTEQGAVTELAALLLATQYITDSLGKEDLYQKRQATSSNDKVLSATVTGQPAPGTHQFTVVRAAQAHQLVGSGFSSDSTAIGKGTLTFRFGDTVQRGLSLEMLNGGNGVALGKLRITDRSGASAEIDLSTAQTIDDVLDAINGNAQINVTATADDGAIRLTDNTGQIQSRLTVQEVGRGTTAASLGLAGIDVDAATAVGSDLVRLSRDTLLADLNDRAGVESSTVLPDIAFQLRDGTTGKIDLSPLASPGQTQQIETTLGDILDVINAASPGKLKAEIAPDGKRLVVTDLTEGSETFSLSADSDSGALADLGLDTASVDGVLTGRRILGGLKTVLLSSLGGGKGIGALGSVNLTDRSGASATVDLSAAETLDDVVRALNQSGIGVTARINDAGTGILLEDTSGGSTAHLTVSNADQTSTVYHLGLTASATATSVDAGSSTSLATGDLHLQVISKNTQLSELNGGAGIARGRIAVYDSNGQMATIDLGNPDIQTVGDVIRAINWNAANVRAQINDTGDGIAIVDLAHGSGLLQVIDLNSTAAADLHLLGVATRRDVEGTSTQVIDGSMTQTVEIDADDTLADLCDKINALNAGVTASIFSDGSRKPFRLVLTSDRTGRVGQLVVDSSQAGFSLQENRQAQDALLALGGSSAGLLVASSANQLDNVVPGVQLNIVQASATPVSITIDTSDSDLVAHVKALVTNYNKFRSKLDGYTAYNAEQNERSILTGDGTALRLETDLARLVTGRFRVDGSIQTLGALGITFTDTGTMELDETALKSAYAANPRAVREFFTAKDVGFSARFKQLSESLAGQDVSLLAQRYKTLDQKIAANQKRIEFMNARLETEKNRLQLQFYRMDLAIGKLKSQLSVIDQIQLITFDTSSSGSSSSSSSSSDLGSLFR